MMASAQSSVLHHQHFNSSCGSDPPTKTKCTCYRLISVFDIFVML